MPFFLLSRGDDGELRLLTSTASPSRQEALAVLSKMTAEPGFEGWDDEVLLVDVDSAFPVLLVRPSETVASGEPRVIAVELDEALSSVDPASEVTFVWPADAEAQSGFLPVVESESPSEIPAEEAEAFASYVSQADEPEFMRIGSADELVVEDVAVSEDVLELPELASELEPGPSLTVEPVVEPAGQELSTAWPVPAEAEGEAEAVQAVVPTEAEEEVVEIISADQEYLQTESAVQAGEPVFEAAPPTDELVSEPDEDSAPTTELTDAEGRELREAIARTTAAMEIEATAEPLPETQEPAVLQEEPMIDRWPWEVAKTTTAVGAVAEPHGAIAEPEDSAGADTPASETTTPESSESDAAPAEPAEQPRKDSGFLDDLEPIAASTSLVVDEPTPDADPSVGPASLGQLESTAVEAGPANADTETDAHAGSARDSGPMDDYVCDDCVYDGTCPNKDQRLPKDCGSFQWK